MEIGMCIIGANAFTNMMLHNAASDVCTVLNICFPFAFLGEANLVINGIRFFFACVANINCATYCWWFLFCVKIELLYGIIQSNLKELVSFIVWDSGVF